MSLDSSNGNKNDDDDSDGGRLNGGASSACGTQTAGEPSPMQVAVDEELIIARSSAHLNRKRLSEGHCNVGCASSAPIGRFGVYQLARKNSLHLIENDSAAQRMPPLTEGKPMQHMRSSAANGAAEMSQLFGSTGGGGCIIGIGNGNGNGGGGGGGCGDLIRRNYSQDDTAVSSSTSLERSPTNTSSSSSQSRRRSSTISQCSSVLSESARQQLNFDLSPDLPPDSSLLEANALDECLGGGADADAFASERGASAPSEERRAFRLATLERRPHSPEPEPENESSAEAVSPEMLSRGSGSNSRPISCVSQCMDELMLDSVAAGGAHLSAALGACSSPDSTLGDSNPPSSQQQSAGAAVELAPLDGRFAALTRPAAVVLASLQQQQQQTSSETSSATNHTHGRPQNQSAGQQHQHHRHHHHRHHHHHGSNHRSNHKSPPQASKSPTLQRCVSASSARSSPNVCGAQATQSAGEMANGTPAPDTPAPRNGGQIATH